MKSWLHENDIEMYSAHTEEKFVVAERFVRDLNNKMYNHLTVVSKNVYIAKLHEIVHKYINKYHRTIKIKSSDVNSDTYIDCDVKHNDKDSNFKIGDHLRISKYKNIFATSYTPDCSEEVLVIKN